MLLQVQIQPRASRDEIVGEIATEQGPRLKIRITAPPIDGKANAHLRKLLAKIFGIAKTRIHIINGETSRNKRLRICAPKKLPEDIQKE
ncbi:DUF167 family protein [Candidatus Venteria ishoeyi]|uniref:UPF0235 protein MBHS_01059 n=1 Tax=Candidatus Venteria ishoeyi TaxID=1899563 RepID=A0A1H6F827_9GAMM|nr:DUF167 family protein [Candidatus Venteria ishoeyi]SEH05206.1 Uncharacterised protein [Candidatus Venteria ishoeyi]